MLSLIWFNGLFDIPVCLHFLFFQIETPFLIWLFFLRLWHNQRNVIHQIMITFFRLESVGRFALSFHWRNWSWINHLMRHWLNDWFDQKWFHLGLLVKPLWLIFCFLAIHIHFWILFAQYLFGSNLTRLSLLASVGLIRYGVNKTLLKGVNHASQGH